MKRGETMNLPHGFISWCRMPTGASGLNALHWPPERRSQRDASRTARRDRALENVAPALWPRQVAAGTKREDTAARRRRAPSYTRVGASCAVGEDWRVADIPHHRIPRNCDLAAAPTIVSWERTAGHIRAVDRHWRQCAVGFRSASRSENRGVRRRRSTRPAGRGGTDPAQHARSSPGPDRGECRDAQVPGRPEYDGANHPVVARDSRDLQTLGIGQAGPPPQSTRSGR